MPKPIRIQRKRVKGWRMPENTVYVGRGSKWGNPFKVGDNYQFTLAGTVEMAVKAMAECQAVYPDIKFYRAHESWTFFRFDIVDNYTAKMAYSFLIDSYYGSEIANGLRGKNLACWCKESEPCHADVLLELANA